MSADPNACCCGGGRDVGHLVECPAAARGLTLAAIRERMRAAARAKGPARVGQRR